MGSYLSKRNTKIIMEKFFTNPGLVSIGEMIFQNLDYQSLVMSQNVCQTWEVILDNPQFWIKSFLNPKIQQDDNSRRISNIEITSVTWKKLFEKTHYTCNNTYSWEYLHWKKLIIETVGFSDEDNPCILKSNVLNVLVEQKRTENGFRNPLYMALKVNDKDLIHYLLLSFLENYYFSQNNTCHTNR